MNFTLTDLCGCLAAVAAGIIVLVLPGIALSCLFRIHAGEPEASGRIDPLAGILAALALLPVLASMSTRFIGLDATLAAILALATAGLFLGLRRGFAPIAPLAFALLFVWFIVLCTQSIDFDVAGRLYQPIEILDGVKHAATTRAILDGDPPLDAFFLRPQHAAYYYFYYTLAALTLRLCGGLADARTAFAGVTFWAGVGAFAAVRLTLARLDGSYRPRTLLILLVMGASGLDCLAVIFLYVSEHYWLIDPLQWNVQAAVWVEDLLWVPHHVTGLIAGLVACVALCDAVDVPEGRRRWLAIAVAGVALASCFGLSVWVAFAFAVTLILWAATFMFQQRWPAITQLALAGLLALILVIPQLIDLKAGRAGGDIPIAIRIRDFSPVTWYVKAGPLDLGLRLFLLPVNYVIEFGVVTIGAAFAWRLTKSGGTFAQLLLLMAIAGLLIGSTLRSTQLGNDLGWRVTLLPLLAGTAWTVIALDRAPPGGEALRTRAAFLFLILGWVTTLYGVAAARIYPFVESSPFASFVGETTDTARDLRIAYEWAAKHMPASAVLQQNPTVMRALAFGLYGRQRTAVGDKYSSLYGADPAGVTGRILALGPIFNDALAPERVRGIATQEKIDALVVTADDPVWRHRASFVWRTPPIFANARVRILPAAAIGSAP